MAQIDWRALTDEQKIALSNLKTALHMNQVKSMDRESMRDALISLGESPNSAEINTLLDVMNARIKLEEAYREWKAVYP